MTDQSAEHVCPVCGGVAHFDREDDAKTKWWKCERCGEQTSKPKLAQSQEVAAAPPTTVEIDAAIDSYGQDLIKPVTLDELKDILDSTIRHDERNKQITFLSMLLTYTDEDQINVSFTAESSAGKSYIPLELAWYFPKDDMIEYSYVSPTSFFHEYGTLMADPTDKRDVEDKEKHKIIFIDLHQKILIFLDQPHDLLLQRLRPLLSHDRKTLIVKITDRRERSGMRTKTVLLQGYPTVLFCTRALQNLLGHRNITNTMLYINMEEAMFKTDEETAKFHYAVAEDIKDALNLLELGFESYGVHCGKEVFRKRK